MATILTKKSDTSSSVPLAADLTNAAGGAELAVNTADKRLYSKTSGGSVVELGTNPSALSLPNGTANGVPYLNGSKVLTSGSALQFDGSNLGLGVTPSAWGSDQKGDAQFGSWLSAGSDAGFGGQISRNGYYNSGWKRINNGTAQLQYFNSDGSISWNLAASGTAGAAITFTQAMTLDASGNLQLGTTASLGRATIAGTVSVLDAAAAGYQTQIRTTNGLSIIDAYQSGSQALAFNTTSGGSSTERARIDSSGWFRFTQSTAVGFLGSAASISGGSANEFCVRSDNALTFATGGSSERARIDSSGNLLVGTTSFAYQPTNGVTLAGGSLGSVGIGHATGTGSGNGYANFTYGGTNIGSISQNGTTAVSYNTTSDYRLKTVIGAVSGAGQRIDALEPVEYEWKSDGSRTRGFLAHKFQEVYAGSVTGSKDAVNAEGKPVYQAMQASSSEVIADLVAELQSMRKRLAALESK